MQPIKPLKVDLCRYLRARNAFGTTEGGANDWYVLGDSNSIFWCVKGLGAGGPDNGPVDPKLCVNGRTCFRERD